MPTAQILQRIQQQLRLASDLEQKALQAEAVEEAHIARPHSIEYRVAKQTALGLRKDIQRLLISVDGLRAMLPADTHTALAA